MNRNNSMKRFWKRVTAVLIAGVLAIGLMGCSFEDIFSGFNINDLPFGEDQSAPTDMGVVDDRVVIPDDSDFDDLRYDPF